jgi:hypothetical protein
MRLHWPPYEELMDGLWGYLHFIMIRHISISTTEESVKKLAGCRGVAETAPAIA